VPEIERRAAQLKTELQELAALRREIEGQRRELESTAAELAKQRQDLERLMARKAELRAQAAERSKAARTEAERLAEEASDMRELMARLDAQAEARAQARAAERVPVPGTKPDLSVRGDSARGEGDEAGARETRSARLAPSDGGRNGASAQQRAAVTKPADIRPFPDSRASLTLPARGRLVTRYGDRVERAGGSVRAQGVELATRAGAQVVAPYDGQVVYAGPFRSYGRILIIEHGGRYHSLLAGLDRIDAVVGQWVLAGEPVGLMDSSGAADPKLYVELRRGGQPVNPLPWLAQTGDKVRG
jgi:septal ring factor EnvC (AmiA/AmiB activator)